MSYKHPKCSKFMSNADFLYDKAPMAAAVLMDMIYNYLILLKLSVAKKN